MSKSYTEEHDLKVFDWPAFLSLPWPSREQCQAASVKASCWVTCACGTLCSALPRYQDGEPKDQKLGQLGQRFHDDVKRIRDAPNVREREHAQRDAMKTLIAIETRSALVLSGRDTIS
jgi:hypothetical protein